MRRFWALLCLGVIGLLSSEVHAQSRWKIEYPEDGTIEILSGNSTVEAQISITGLNELKRKSRGVDCASGGSESICKDWGSHRFEARLDSRCINTQVTANAGANTGPGVIYVYESKYRGHLYGGAEQKKQYYPLDDVKYEEYSYITKEEDSAAIAERYWFTSDGMLYYVPPEVSLFLRQNLEDHSMSFHCENKSPYPSSRPFICEVTMCKFNDAKEAHLFAIENYLGKPEDIPDERMIKYPIWSTWAKYKRDITEETVLEFANEINENGFKNSQLEIDDKWEPCYGSLTFDTTKFPNMKGLSDTLKAKGFRVTLWVHPFINNDCVDIYKSYEEKKYLAKNAEGKYDTSWWNGEGATVDFTNPDAAKDWVDRLEDLMDKNGIDSLKFDAGETSWLPQVPVFSDDIEISLQPNIYTQKFVEAVTKFGNMAEIRTGFQTQKYPNLVRMIDKDTKWTFENGLPTLITTMIQMNLAGYPFVLPDMVGGNGYEPDGSIGSGGTENAPSKELFIRWLQANVFMPSIQFSFVPWDYDDETVKISKNLLELHEKYSDKIIEAMKKAVKDGTPVNPPIWWIDPTDENALVRDDEFLLGETILVAPVLKEGAKSRDIYLPVGIWVDKLRNNKIEGPVLLKDYAADLHELPYFELGSTASSLHTLQVFCLLVCLLVGLLNLW